LRDLLGEREVLQMRLDIALDDMRKKMKAEDAQEMKAEENDMSAESRS